MPQNAKIWNRRFAELEAYKKEHGDCNVRRKFPTKQWLNHWVGYQRKLHKNGKLAKDQVKRLEELGFRFKIWADWHERFGELKKFKNENGHCDVPCVYVANVQLASWVYHQRRFYRKGKLSEERTALLESVGFRWSTKNPPLPVSNDSDAGDENESVASAPRGSNGMSSAMEAGRNAKRKLEEESHTAPGQVYVSPTLKTVSSERRGAVANPGPPTGKTRDEEHGLALYKDLIVKLVKKVEKQKAKIKNQKTKIKSLKDELAKRENGF